MTCHTVTDTAFLLQILGDGKGHSRRDIEKLSELSRGKGITVHSRAAQLRRQGYDIVQFRNGTDTVYVLAGKRDGRVHVRMQPVQGYSFESIDDDHPRNNTICKIIRRAVLGDVELREYGPAFTVEFGDGEIMNVFASELHPWYPV